MYWKCGSLKKKVYYAQWRDALKSEFSVGAICCCYNDRILFIFWKFSEKKAHVTLVDYFTKWTSDAKGGIIISLWQTVLTVFSFLSVNVVMVEYLNQSCSCDASRSFLLQAHVALLSPLSVPLISFQIFYSHAQKKKRKISFKKKRL